VKPTASIERQREALAGQAGRIAWLIEQLREEERTLDNRRAVRREIEGLVTVLQRIESERRRLAEEIAALGSDSPPAISALDRWEENAAAQTRRIEEEIAEWRRGQASGLRRRGRDLETLAALEAEANRVRHEVERLRALAGRTKN